MFEYSVGVIPGDGIGPEVMNEAHKVLKAVEQVHSGIKFNCDSFDWNCDYYLSNGKMMPENGLDLLENYDVILFGAVGSQSVPDHVSVWELILPIRKRFQQYVNLRPIKLLRGLESPLRNKYSKEIDFTIVRENTEGEYSKIGGNLHEGTPNEVVVQNSLFTRYGTERIFKYAYNLAKKNSFQKLTIATKSNAINYAMPFWDEVAREIGLDFPKTKADFYHVDALAALFVSNPEYFDVVVASNLFGDILSDLGAAVAGGLGLAPSGNINPEGVYPSMFEPVHGSAPDIAGKGIANPIAQIWSLSLMLEHLELQELSNLIMDSIEEVLIEGKIKTPDLGGNSTTSELGSEISSKILLKSNSK